MDIAIIGTGRVGTALGRRWAAAGHSVVFGSRRAGTRTRASSESRSANSRANPDSWRVDESRDRAACVHVRVRTAWCVVLVLRHVLEVKRAENAAEFFRGREQVATLPIICERTAGHEHRQEC